MYRIFLRLFAADLQQWDRDSALRDEVVDTAAPGSHALIGALVRNLHFENAKWHRLKVLAFFWDLATFSIPSTSNF